MAMRSDFFRNTVLAAEASKERAGTEDTPIVKVPGVSAEMMEQVLAYIYTDTCDYLVVSWTILQKNE